MDFRNRRAIHDRARSVLEAASGNIKKIPLCYTLVMAVMILGFSFITDALSNGISNTGGLGNMGMRSILATGQNILPIVQLVVSMCLNLGYHCAILRIARQQEASPRTLLDGFRYFGPILRATLFQTFLYLSFGILTLYAAGMVFAMTPFAEPFYAVMEPYMASASALSTGQLILDQATLVAAADTLVPMLYIWLGLFLLLFLPAHYGYRMTAFCIADNPRMGAFACLRKSKYLLRGNRFALLRLDLTLWWFYGLQILISLLCYGDSLLPLLGIQLPWSANFSFYFFYVLSQVAQLLVYYFLLNRANAVYAVAYDVLQNERIPGTRRTQEGEPDSDLPFSTNF